MPKYWHDRHASNVMSGDDDREFNRSIVAEKKPYFMRYIYPALMRQYNTYIKNTDRNALREFGMTVSQLEDLQDKSDRQNEFLKYYRYRIPVGIGNCVMNRICKKFEDMFDGFVGRASDSSKFDYTIMKSGADYSARQYNAIQHLYTEYNKRISSYSIFADYERIDASDSAATLSAMNDEFKKECEKECPDARALCDIIVDICYKKSSTKRFAWNMCGGEIVRNLLEKNGGVLSYPSADQDGELQYGGKRFSVKEIKIGVV